MRALTGRRAARVLHATVVAMVLAGVGTELVRALVDGPGAAGTMAERLTRLFSYFTIDSNLLVGVTSALLLARPDRDGPVFRVLRLVGVLCISVTGIVYHTVLTGLHDLTPSGAFADLMLHTTVPLVAVVAWLLVGPRPRIAWSTVWWAVVPPVGWIAYTFARGAVVDWYPYPFLDVTQIGYPMALVNTAIVAVVFVTLAAGARLVDRWLPPAPTQPSTAAIAGASALNA